MAQRASRPEGKWPRGLYQRASGREGYTRGLYQRASGPEGKWPRGLVAERAIPEGYTRGLVAQRASGPEG